MPRLIQPPPQGAGLPTAMQPALLRRLEWRVRHAVETVLTGEYRSSFRGRGMEFDQVVKYEFGDDVRDIDWNVTARLGEPYRKKFVEEREVCLLVLFEDTPSLQFGSEERTRRDTLLELAASLMLLGAVNRDRVGVIYTSPAGFWYKRPLPGRQNILHSASALLGQPPPPIDSVENDSVPWQFAMNAAPRHSVLLWLGPFVSDREPDVWNVMKRRYQAMGFRADDPWDRELPKDTIVSAYDPVSGSLTQINTRSQAQRKAHAEWVEHRNRSFAGLFPHSADRLAVNTDESVFDAMVSFFHKRSRSATTRS